MGKIEQNLAEVSSIDLLHGEEKVSLPVSAEFVNGQGARVLDVGGNSGFADEALGLDLGIPQVLMKSLPYSKVYQSSILNHLKLYLVMGT